MRISDWSSDVCSSDLALLLRHVARQHADPVAGALERARDALDEDLRVDEDHRPRAFAARQQAQQQRQLFLVRRVVQLLAHARGGDRLRSEEHTSELQSLMRISYAVFCLTKKTLINKDILLKHEVRD